MAEAVKEERRSLLAPDVERWPLDQPIIELKDVWKSFGENDVIRGLSLTVPTGATTVIIGESGSGKSVLLKLMNGLVRADRGEVRLFGKNLADLSESERIRLRKRTGMVLQNYALFDSLKVWENIAFPLLENTKIPVKEARRRVRELLELLEIAPAEERTPSELSGGMKKRVSFARAVISQPELVLFDEPTTGLDPVMIEFVDELVIKMRELYDITSVIISHDIGSVYKLADQIAMLDGGRIIESGSPEAFRQTTHPTVRNFISVGGSGRLTGPEDLDVKPEEPSASTAPEAEPLVKLVEVHKKFGTNHVLRGVNLSIAPKKITVIIGGSGSGKSVIIKHMIGLLQPTSGEVWFQGQNLTQISRRDLASARRKIGMLFQGAALFDSMTVRENVLFPLVEKTQAVPKKEAEAMMADALERLHLQEIANLYPSDISAGQRKRVGLARAIVTKPELMIYDEPTTGQDPVMIRYVDDMIQEAQEAFDLTSVVISHDMQSTFRIADYVAMLHKGEIAAFGTPSEVMASTDPNVRRFVFAGADEDEP